MKRRRQPREWRWEGESRVLRNSWKDLRQIAIKAAGMSKDRLERARWVIYAILLGRPFSLRMLQFAEWEPHNAFFKADPRIPRRNPRHFPYRACRDIGRRLKWPLEPNTLPYYEVSFSHGLRTCRYLCLAFAIVVSAISESANN
jgi:hypothetical protein